MPDNDSSRRCKVLCKTCGKSFINMQNMRSHQSRSCLPGRTESSVKHINTPAEHVQSDATALPTSAETMDSFSDFLRDIDGEGQNEMNESRESRPILQQLDDRRRIADDIFRFYDSLSQWSEPIITEPVSMTDVVRECPAHVQTFIDNCKDKSLSKQAISAMYTTITCYENSLPEQHRLISHHIPRLSTLHALLRSFQAERLYRESWRKCIIDLNDLHPHLDQCIPINTSGTFRCPLGLLRAKLDAHGTWDIESFRRSENESALRTFSCPSDSVSLQMYSHAIGQLGTVVCIDVYCDGIALPNNGALSLSPLRVRFPNIRAIQTVWYDIGLCPVLHMGNAMCTATKLAELRSELLQRYLFMVLKPLIEASSVGFRHDCTVIYPRIVMILCDQKQERPFLCLKCSTSTRDCTACDMLSKVTAAEVQNRNPGPQPQKQRKKRVRSDTGSASDSSTSSTTAAEKARKKSHQAAYAAETLLRQRDPTPASPRNVLRTIGAQLILAITKIKVKKGETTELLQKLRRNMAPFWFDKSDEDIKSLRHFSMQYSFSELPPCLAAFHGLGTEPFFLYNSIAFDSLNDFDLGVVRMLPDLCFEHFSGRVNYTTLPTTQCISVANSRLKMVPRGAQLSKIPLFIGKCSDQLAGVTGLARRKSCPFLWLCLLGLNNKLTPDTDPLLLSALELNEVNCKLFGINEDASCIHRSRVWIQQLQDQCFKLGSLLTSLFNAPVNTKLHRFMRHIQDHLISFGTLKWGATDQNETQHKSLKLAYRQTNRRPDSLAVQLLRKGYADGFDSDPENVECTTEPSQPGSAGPEHVSIAETITLQELGSSQQFHRRLAKVLALKYTQEKSVVWYSISHITLDISIPWTVDSRCQYVRRKFTYRPWSSTGDNIRTDACVYRLHTTPFHGLVQLILRSSKTADKIFFVMRRLVESESISGCTVPSTKYKHQRFKYATNVHGGMALDLVPAENVQYPIFLVVDPTVLVTQFSYQTTTLNSLETEQHRMKSRFFNVQGVPLTSFKEYLLDTTE